MLMLIVNGSKDVLSAVSNFNTSHVNVNLQVKQLGLFMKAISIHLMLMLIQRI